MLKEIDPSVRTHSTFLSFRGRQTALGLTTVVITPLQHNCDSTVTRMNRLSSHSKYLLSGKLYIYPLHLFLIYTLYNLYLIIFSRKSLIASCGLYATFPSISMSLLLSTVKLCVGPCVYNSTHLEMQDKGKQNIVNS